MNNHTNRRLNLYELVLEFFFGLGLDKPPAAVAKLQSVVSRAKDLLSRQSIGLENSRVAVGSKGEAQAALVKEHLAAIRNAMLSLKGVIPAIERSFVIPSPKDGHKALIALAETVKARAKENETALIEAGLPETFIADLTAAIKATEKAGNKRVKAKETYTGATEALEVIDTEGRRNMRSLHAWVLSHLKGDREKLNHWKRVRRQESDPSTPASSPPPSAPLPPPPSSPSVPAA